MHESMRMIAVIGLAVGMVVSPAAGAGGQEPPRPTPSPSATQPAVPAPGHSLHGEAFNEGPRQRARLLPGMGKVHFPVSTASSEAQAFVDQGVAQLHSFYYFEAERSFRQAAMVDPGCAMAYWGMALANVNNPRRARGFLEQARRRAASLTRRELLYLEAAEAQFREGGSDQDRRRDALLGLETIVQDFPDDLDARAWLAMITWQNAGKDGIGSRQAVDTLIETVLQAEPMHPGAHHYRIHLWDGVKPIRAEGSAALYARAAPGIAHAWHMPGHTYTGLHRYADAADQQEGSARVDHASMMRDRVMPFEIHNYAHNNQWLCTTYSHLGRVKDAVAVARNLVEQPRDPQKNGPNDGGSAQRSGRIRWAEVLVRYELWDDLIAATTSGALDWSEIPLERRQRAYTLGLAYAARNQTGPLTEQVEVLRKLAQEEAQEEQARKPDEKPKAGDNPPRSKDPWELATPETRSALAELEGFQLLARGEVGPAFEKFAQAESMRPEALARAHLAARNYGLAESVARKAVADHPNELPPLGTLIEILQAAGKDEAAQELYCDFLSQARRADRDLPLVRRLEAIAARWKAEGRWTLPPAEPAGTDEAAASRPDLNELGPLLWSPFPAEPLSGLDAAGRTWDLAQHPQKTVLAIFFLGGKCAHCMQQLQVFGQEFEALRNLGVETVAISTDDPQATRAILENPDGIRFPMPILPDPGLERFRRYGAFDDFESQPLHGIFLIDRQRKVRFQRVSADPFMEVEFIKGEAQRVARILEQNSE
jgi:peroxiredoxin